MLALVSGRLHTQLILMRVTHNMHTHTLALSLSGSHLADPLPEWSLVDRSESLEAEPVEPEGLEVHLRGFLGLLAL